MPKEKKPVLMTRQERNNLIMQIIHQYDSLKTGIPLPPHVITGTRIYIDEGINFIYDYPMPQVDRILQIRLYNNKRQKSFFNLKFTGNESQLTPVTTPVTPPVTPPGTIPGQINSKALNEEMQKMIQDMIKDAKNAKKNPDEGVFVSRSGKMSLSDHQTKVINQIKETKIVDEIPAEITNNPSATKFSFELPTDDLPRKDENSNI